MTTLTTILAEINEPTTVEYLDEDVLVLAEFPELELGIDWQDTEYDLDEGWDA